MQRTDEAGREAVTHVYVAIYGDSIRHACADCGDEATADFVARAVLDGGIVERWPVDEARELGFARPVDGRHSGARAVAEALGVPTEAARELLALGFELRRDESGSGRDPWLARELVDGTRMEITVSGLDDERFTLWRDGDGSPLCSGGSLADLRRCVVALTPDGWCEVVKEIRSHVAVLNQAAQFARRIGLDVCLEIAGSDVAAVVRKEL